MSRLTVLGGSFFKGRRGRPRNRKIQRQGIARVLAQKLLQPLSGELLPAAFPQLPDRQQCRFGRLLREAMGLFTARFVRSRLECCRRRRRPRSRSTRRWQIRCRIGDRPPHTPCCHRCRRLPGLHRLLPYQPGVFLRGCRPRRGGGNRMIFQLSLRLLRVSRRGHRRRPGRGPGGPRLRPACRILPAGGVLPRVTLGRLSGTLGPRPGGRLRWHFRSGPHIAAPTAGVWPLACRRDIARGRYRRYGFGGTLCLPWQARVTVPLDHERQAGCHDEHGCSG